MTDKRDLNPDEPVALDDRDPSNTDLADLIQPLDPDDDVFALVNPEHGTQLENAPVDQDPQE